MLSNCINSCLVWHYNDVHASRDSVALVESRVCQALLMSFEIRKVFVGEILGQRIHGIKEISGVGSTHSR